MCSALVRIANELVLISCSDKQGYYVATPLLCEVNLFTKLPESLDIILLPIVVIFCVNTPEIYTAS